MNNNTNYYSDQRISNSSLGYFMESPRYFKLMFDHIIEGISGSFLERGEAYHMFILEREEFDKTYTVIDFTKPKGEQEQLFCEKVASSSFVEYSDILIEAYSAAYKVDSMTPETIAGKALEKARKLSTYIAFLKQSKEGKRTISKADREWLELLSREIINNKTANSLIFERKSTAEYYTESYIEWEYSFEGDSIPCKSLIDRFIVDHDTKEIKLVDLKTSSSFYKFPAESFIKFDYARQLAFYIRALKFWIKTERPELADYEINSYIVCVSTDKRFADAQVYAISTNTLKEADNRIEPLLQQITKRWKDDNWVSDEIKTL